MIRRLTRFLIDWLRDERALAMYQKTMFPQGVAVAGAGGGGGSSVPASFDFIVTVASNVASCVNAAGTVISTGDPRTVIQAAWAAASAINGTVKIRTGTYTLNGSLIPQSNVACYVDAGAIIQQPPLTALANSFSLIATIGGTVTNFLIDGGVWNGNKNGLTDHRGTGTWSSYFNQYEGVLFGYASGQTFSGLTFRNMTVENCVGQGILLMETSGSLVQRCIMLNNGDNPISFDGSSVANWVHNGVVEDCLVNGGQDVGINVNGGAQVVIARNTVTNMQNYSGASHWGIAAEDGAYFVTIAENMVSGCDYGIEVAGGSVDVAVIGNVVDATTMTGGMQAQTCTRTFWIGNQVSFATNYGFTTYGAATVDLIVIGNLFYSTSKNQITATRAYIAGNYFYGYTCLVFENGSSINMKFFGNTFVCTTTSTSGITDNGYSHSGTEFIGNDFSGLSGSTGIYMDTGTNVRLKDNDGYNPVGVIATPILSGVLSDKNGSSSTWVSTTVYTNNGSPKDIYIRGGTVTQIQKNGTTIATATLTTTDVFVHLEPTDTIEITFSAAPTIVVYGV